MFHSARIIASALVLAVALSVGFQVSAQSNPSPSGDPFIGRYEGTYKATGRDRVETVAEVLSQGRGIYHVQIHSNPPVHLELYGVAQGPLVRINGYSNNTLWNGTIEDGRLKVQRDSDSYGSTFTLKKVIQHSPTEGLKPPKNATVLIPITDGKPDLSGWTNDKWEALDGGVMLVKGATGSNSTKATHGDFKLHLEFKTAHMPEKSGQGRSNSGVYFHDRYEVQVLDSFGLIPGSGDAGSIYQQSVTAVNASYPPGQWQTYDAVYTGPKFDKDGKIKKFPTVTIKHNGVLIQDKHEFKTVTGGAAGDEHVERAPFRLQDHGDPVQYRNIWWVEK